MQYVMTTKISRSLRLLRLVSRLTWLFEYDARSVEYLGNSFRVSLLKFASFMHIHAHHYAR